ncbi:MAG: hypothetical protein R2911_07700 [Caldilineaceae bacterium]
MPELQSREIRLKSRPVGLPTAENFELVTTSVPEPTAGQMVVQNLYMSVDPYMRGRMNDRKSYTPPFQLGEALNGGAVGKVVASNEGKFQPGDYVSNGLGWREYFISDGRGLTQIDPDVAPVQAYLGAAGSAGTNGLFWPARHWPAQGGRNRFCVGGGGRGWLHSLPDCQDQGLPRGGQRRVRRPRWPGCWMK